MLFVVSAPSGTGKTTLVDMLTKEFPNIVRSVSLTTRSPRLGERDGVDYHFVSKEIFAEHALRDDFLEHAEVFGYRYGTSKEFVEREESRGNHVILVIDTQGAKQVMKKNRGVFIFISPPSRKEQRSRLEKRSTESEEMMNLRLEWDEAEAALYNYQIVNRDLGRAYEELKGIIEYETANQ